MRPAVRLAESHRAIDAYALVHGTSVAGDALLAVALADSVFFSLPVDQARTKVALYLLLTMAPLAVVAPLLARLLDRGGFRRVVTVIAAAGRAVLAVLMASRTASLLVFPLAFGVLVLARIHLVSKNALTAAYADESEGLVSANALLSRVAAVSAAVAALAGVAAAKLGGAGTALVLAGAAYLACAVLSLRLPSSGPTRPAPGERGAAIPLPVRVAGVGMTGVRAGSGFLIFLIAFTVRRVHEPAYWLGVLVGAVAVGTFLGALAAPRLARTRTEGNIVLGSLVVAAAGAIAVAARFSLEMLAGFALLAGLVAEAARLAFQSLMQRAVAPGNQGRAFVRYEVLFQLAWVGGAFIPAMIPVTFRQGLAAMAAMYVGVAVANVAARRRAGGPA